MTKQKRSRQSWSPLYIMAIIIIGLLFLAHRMAPSPGWRIFLEIGVVVIGYGLAMLWLEIHPAVLLSQPPEEEDRPAVVELPEVEKAPVPLASVPRRLYTGYNRVIVYGGPGQSNGHLHSNGNHHRVEPLPSLPEERTE
jgi:hypothetical protein